MPDDIYPFLVIASTLVFVVVVVVTVAFLVGAYKPLAERSLQRTYAELTIHTEPESGDVIITYYTYHGFLVWVTQNQHFVAMPPEDARVLLGRLLRFNLTWGLVSLGSFFVVPLAILDYFGQRRSIDRQEATGQTLTFVAAPAKTEVVAPAKTEVVVEPKPFFHRMVGWFCAMMSGAFLVAVLLEVVIGEYQAAGVGVLPALIFGWIALSWLRQPKGGANG
ncbi:hypothetical protein GC197_12380 [bacterium]|nr:hypothetical protein [bacterium]